MIAHERSSRYDQLLDAIDAVVFMGTPHRGAEIAYWGKVFGNMANIPLLGSIRTNILSDLAPKSATLGDICYQFVERGKKLEIFSLYERRKISGLNCLVRTKSPMCLSLPFLLKILM